MAEEGQKDQSEKLSPFPHSMRMGNDGTRPDRWDALCPMEWCLVRQDVAWVWLTTTARPGARNKAPPQQAALCLPRWDLERPNYGISAQERLSGFLSRSDGSCKRQETGKEQRDTPCGPCRLRHERRVRIPGEHF